MRKVHPGPLLGLLGQLLLLAGLAAAAAGTGPHGLGAAGWVAGAAWGLVTAGLLSRGMTRAGRVGLGPANRVTLVRSVLVGGVTALGADAFAGPVRTDVLVGLCVVALALDGVDGWVARRTGSVSALGARFDMEVDAFLILVLSVHAAVLVGPWVLAIGAARYAAWLAGRLVGWLAVPVPPRYWRKPVAAIQGIVLTAVAAHLLPTPALVVALVVALGLLSESFGRDVVWQWRQRRTSPGRAPGRVRARATTAAAVLAVWAVLVLPVDAGRPGAGTLARIPVEALLLVTTTLLLGRRARTGVSTLAGLALGLLAVLRLLDLAFVAVLAQPFDPRTDLGYLRSAAGLLRDTAGLPATVAAVVAAALLSVLVVLLLTGSARRVARAAAAHRSASTWTVSLLAMAWLLSASLGVRAGGVAVAASATADLSRRAPDTLVQPWDPYATVAPADLLAGLRGHDVLVVFVESYGRVAVADSPAAPSVDALLQDGSRELAGAGFSARSAYLTSPTSGGLSWLAHATLQSGLWIDDQHRYDQLLRSRRLTLTAAFGRAGWRTVSDIPSDAGDWPEGRAFYGYDQLYSGSDVGYRGPAFSYAAVPDQYTLAAFRQAELSREDRPPVMAEIDLVSSHGPWAPLPRMVDDRALGDGSVYAPMAAAGPTPQQLLGHPDRIQAAYAESIRYSLTALLDFVARSHDPDLVVVALGDHQPATVVTGPGARPDVPVSVIAADPDVLDRIGSWGWSEGLLPDPAGPVWPMDAFRDRFLSAYGPVPGAAAGQWPSVAQPVPQGPPSGDSSIQTSRPSGLIRGW